MAVLVHRPPLTHVLHGPVQALSQQIPSTQFPLRHSTPPLQALPSAFLPMQFPPMQMLPGVQSLFPVHWPFCRQAVPAALHMNGAQLLVAAAEQVPLPVQVPAEVSVEPLQLCARHMAVIPCFRQAPAPSQVPSFPHVAGAAAAQPLLGSAAPAGTLVHVPCEPTTAQLLQPSVQALLQQKPSTQLPLVHSLAAVQAAPFPLVPQLPVGLQVLGGRHWVLLLHDEVQSVPAALQT